MKLDKITLNASFFAKKQIRSLGIIFKFIAKQKTGLQDNELKESNEVIHERIRIIANEVYSGCEIINELFIALYRNDDRYRGSKLKNGFSSNYKTIHNAIINRSNELKGVYRDSFIYSFFKDAQKWYITLHDIRTQEIHYEVGTVEKYNQTYVYKNGNRNGISKAVYSNADDELEIELKEFLNYIDDFLKNEDRIVELVQKYFKDQIKNN